MSEQNHQKRPIALPQSVFGQKHQIAYSLYELSCAVEVFFKPPGQYGPQITNTCIPYILPLSRSL